MQKELDAEKPEGEEALNNLFKSIYGKVSWSALGFDSMRVFAVRAFTMFPRASADGNQFFCL